MMHDALDEIEDLTLTWQELLVKHYEALYATCLKILRCPHMAREAMSEVVALRLDKLIDSYDASHGVPLLAYIRTSLRWYILKWRMKQAKIDQEASSLDIMEYLGDSSLVTNDGRSSELTEYIGSIMSKLEEHHKAVLMMRAVQGMTFEQIGQALSCSKGGAHRLYKLAIQRCKELA